MILRNITLYLPPSSNKQKDIEYSYSLLKKSRHILNFIERVCLRKIKFEAKDFKGIVILLENDIPINKASITITKILSIPIFFDRKSYEISKNAKDLRLFVEGCIAQALEKVQGKYSVPTAEILQTLAILKKNDYINEWIHATKTDVKRKVNVELYCCLTIDEFSLRLIISIGGTEIFNKVVLVTDPDEVAYHYQFNEIVIEGDKILVTQKSSGNLLEYSIKQNKIIKFAKDEITESD